MSKDIKNAKIRIAVPFALLMMAAITVITAPSVNVYGQTGSKYDIACNTNIANNQEAKEMLTTYHNLFGPNVEDFPPASKELYTCINTIYEQETANNVKTQLDDQYEGMNPLTAGYLKDLRDGGIDDDGDGEGSDDEDDNNPDIQ